ncbi:uncharacterized protein V6R79_016937 [Siganus canaliculatus]
MQMHTILREATGPTKYAIQNIDSKLSAFMCLCDEVMLEEICDCTTAEALRADKDNAWDFSVAELKAFIAILYVRGACCGNGLDLESFWSEEWGNVFFKTTLSRERFRKIMRYLRFDLVATRSQRQATDKFTHVRMVWDRFVQNSIKCYKPGLDITVDEQLFPTKSRCPFTQYMPSKPDKFGIKFWLAVDVESKYMLNGFPYLGKDESRPATQGLGESVVMKLVEPFLDKGRNITTDNFFTSLKLAEKLISRKTSLVGTMNTKRRKLPPSVGEVAKLFSTKLLKHDKVVLSIYQCRPKKNVVILSTRHRSVTISKEQKRKPETVTYYNHSKVGVDVLNQMLRKYTVKASTQRWPVAVFYNILDMAIVNSWVLYRSCTNEKISRRDFMQQLALELRAEWMALKEPPPHEVLFLTAEEPEERRRMTCMVKSNCKQNKTFSRCLKCLSPVCGRCTAETMSVCSGCI